MSSKETLAKNTVLIALSKMSTQLIAFLMLPFYTTILSTGEYGTVDLIITYGGLFAPLIMLNMEMAVFRHLIDARDKQDVQNKIITNAFEIVFRASAIAAIIFAIVSIFASMPMAVTIAFYFLASAFSSLVVQIARGLGRIKAFAITSIFIGILGVLFSVLFMAVLGLGPTGMLLGLSIGAITPTIILAFFLKIHKSIKLSTRERQTKKELLAYSLPLIPNSISWWVFNASDRSIISLVLGVASNGIYAVSNKFSAILSGLWGVFYVSWNESASIEINKPGHNKFFSEVANTSVRVFGTLAILGTALTPIAFPFLANNQFDEALLYVPVLMLATFLNAIVGFYSAIYIAKKLTKQVMNTSITAAIINLAVCLSLIWFIGIWAAAVSTAVAYLVMATYRHYDMKKYVKITYQKSIFASLALLAIIVCIFYYLNNPILNIFSACLAIITSIALNSHLIKKLLPLLKSFLKKK